MRFSQILKKVRPEKITRNTAYFDAYNSQACFNGWVLKEVLGVKTVEKADAIMDAGALRQHLPSWIAKQLRNYALKHKKEFGRKTFPLHVISEAVGIMNAAHSRFTRNHDPEQCKKIRKDVIKALEEKGL